MNVYPRITGWYHKVDLGDIMICNGVYYIFILAVDIIINLIVQQPMRSKVTHIQFALFCLISNLENPTNYLGWQWGQRYKEEKSKD